MRPGSIVRCRNREWVLLPGETDDLFLLRPLTGVTDQAVAVHRYLSERIAYTLPEERVTPASFPLPTPDDLADAAGAHLLWQAARLTLREGAAPLRSLGRISIRPRTYQFVPLLMALRLDPVRLLIADDVGVGKTIEALLIARELWERGEIRRLCVLAPPYLCDQWQEELTTKANLEAVVVRPGTISQLERESPPGVDFYEHFPVQVISIDWVKTDRHRHRFLIHAPEFVIVDEAHGAAPANTRAQQERHELVRALANNPQRHLVLLTATPHSGVPETFQALLSLLNKDFGAWNVAALTEEQRTALARHFVQRTRADILHDWEGRSRSETRPDAPSKEMGAVETLPFPQRIMRDETYRLSPAYQDLFQRTYAFCAEIVRTGERLVERQRRVRYWGALALLRCVMSSPAAAQAALEARQQRLGGDGFFSDEEDEADFAPAVFESAEDRTDDETPYAPIGAAELTLAERERRQLRDLARRAAAIQEHDKDAKVVGCVNLVRGLLDEGLNPIVWCRYVATAEYVAQRLRRDLFPVRVVCITGRQAEEERRELIASIDLSQPRVLVATDCLSEGINLQERFTAAIHYDLPWNPNRLEQREGRVDRYGQPAPQVVTVRYYSPDNPVDGVLLDVLLNKAREIRNALGTHVPVPEANESVTEAVLKALFLRGGARAEQQLQFDFVAPEVSDLHRRWDEAAARERISRTRFAQRAIRADEVQRELEAVDAVLGDPDAVRMFVLTAAQRIGLPISPDPKRPAVFQVHLTPEVRRALPDALLDALPESRSEPFWTISFVSPTPEGAEYVGRNHRLVASLAGFLLEEALTRRGAARAARCGVIRTRAVARLTTLCLLRVRYLIEIPELRPSLAEEVRVFGSTSEPGGALRALDDDEALRLLVTAQPDANVPPGEKRDLISATLAQIGEWKTTADEWGQDHDVQRMMRQRLVQRAAELTAAHRRIRQAMRLRVRDLTVQPQFPPDLLGVLVLQPLVEG
ncbi:MAG: DEAD/DEAH box helicase [Roseiflexus sp.]|nr:DEAD/DEAH box helicase [Roseiflexus sp.]